jgi:hypothetical protein
MDLSKYARPLTEEEKHESIRLGKEEIIRLQNEYNGSPTKQYEEILNSFHVNSFDELSSMLRKSCDLYSNLDFPTQEMIRQYKEVAESAGKSISDLISNQESFLESHYKDFQSVLRNIESTNRMEELQKQFINSTAVNNMILTPQGNFDTPSNDFFIPHISSLDRRQELDNQERIIESLETVIEQQNQIISKQSEHNTQQKVEIELLKNKLEHLENLSSINNSVEKIAIQTEILPIIPDYIKSLVDDGYVETDGKTAILSLDEIASYIYSTLGIDTINYKMLMQFCQHDGQPFSENSAKEAAKRCKIKK